jgi:hypothetical protein
MLHLLLALIRFRGNLNVTYGGVYGAANATVHVGVDTPAGGLGQFRGAFVQRRALIDRS